MNKFHFATRLLRPILFIQYSLVQWRWQVGLACFTTVVCIDSGSSYISSQGRLIMHFGCTTFDFMISQICPTAPICVYTPDFSLPKKWFVDSAIAFLHPKSIKYLHLKGRKRKKKIVQTRYNTMNGERRPQLFTIVTNIYELIIHLHSFHIETGESRICTCFRLWWTSRLFTNLYSRLVPVSLHTHI